MKQLLSNWKNIDSKMYWWVVFMVGYSLVVVLWAWMGDFGKAPSGIHIDLGYKSYFQQLNWLLYPVFFLAIFPVIHYSWFWFLHTWKENDTKKPILRKGNGEEISGDIRKRFIENINSLRNWLLIPAFLFAGLFCWFDTSDLRKVYFSQTNFGQLEFACKEPDFFGKWLFSSSSKKNPCENFKKDSKPGNVAHNLSVKIINDDQILLTVKPNKVKALGGKKIHAPPSQWSFTMACYFQQFTILMMGFLILFQILAHIFFFGFPTTFIKTAKEEDLSIWLNYESELKDFGLSPWNQVLDKVYWMFLLGMLIALISKSAQPDLENLDLGQLIGQWLLGLLIIAPLLLTGVARQKWIHVCQLRALKSGSGAIASFEKQKKIWPFTKDIHDKFGILASFVVWGFMTGVDIIKIFKSVLL